MSTDPSVYDTHHKMKHAEDLRHAPPCIPGYRIERLIDRGAMGHVYWAMDERLDRPVAIKVIDASLNEDPTFRQRFLKEGKIVARLRHPHIVTLYGIGEHHGQYYMIMEYIEGGTLKERIRQGLSAEQAVRILRHIADALGSTHRQGFIHRDIKPTNILFHDPDHAVLSDFGIAKACEEHTSLTVTGLTVGSPLYMSPEQRLGQTLDERSDLYSLGLVFFEMLTGALPERTSQGVHKRLPPELSHHQKILDRLLADAQDERFRTAEALIQALDDLNPPNNPAPFQRSIKGGWNVRHRFTLCALGGGLLLAVMGWAGVIEKFSGDHALPEAVPVQVSYTYLPAGDRAALSRPFRPLVDGGRLQSGDYYRIRLMPEAVSYIYLFQIDGHGAPYRLFPVEASDPARADHAHPVPAGVPSFVPAEPHAFQLDEQTGQEHIYVLAFRKRHLELEHDDAALAQARQIQDSTSISTLQERLVDRLQRLRGHAASVLQFEHHPRERSVP